MPSKVPSDSARRLIARTCPRIPSHSDREPSFSTGRWEGGALIVTTTHLKTSWLRRNGVPRSDRATVVERFTRHGNYLSVVTTVYDPVYLSEPYVRSREMVLTRRAARASSSARPSRKSRGRGESFRTSCPGITSI